MYSICTACMDNRSIAIYSKEHLNVPHKSYTDAARFAVWAAIFTDTLVNTVWVVGICMHNFHGFLLWYFSTIDLCSCGCKTSSSIAMCVGNWWNSLYKQTHTHRQTHTHIHIHIHTCITTTFYVIYTAPNAHSCTTMATYVQCSTRI